MPKAYPLFNPDIKSIFGGSEVDLFYIATELAKDDAFNVTFIVADYGQDPNETRMNVRILKSFKPTTPKLLAFPKLLQSLDKADADIYITKTASPGVPLINWFCKNKKRHFIYRSAHSDECDGTWTKTHKLLGHLFHRALRSASAVITQNITDQKNLLETIKVDSTVIPNAHRISPADPKEKNTILWVARSADFKQPRLFLDLARAFPTENFTMICPQATGDKNYPALKETAEKIQNLTFHEQVPFHETRKYFAQAKVFVNTSRSEGFPNTFIQAALAAAPILSLAVNPDEILTKQSLGIACKNDFEKLKQGLAFLLDDSRFVEIGQNAQNWAKQNYDISFVIEQYKTLFRKVTGKR